jgi:hypothetical protein
VCTVWTPLASMRQSGATTKTTSAPLKSECASGSDSATPARSHLRQWYLRRHLSGWCNQISPGGDAWHVSQACWTCRLGEEGISMAHACQLLQSKVSCACS